jgi:phosphatidate phosphatase APP1
MSHFQENPNAPILLLSDLDDTIKISHTQSKIITIYRGLFRSAAFAGMATLYHELMKNPHSQFYLVSSSPPQIKKKIENFLNKNEFPLAKIVLRDWIRQPNILKYKLKIILEICEKSPYPLILIGDDTEHDPEVFQHVEKRFPKKIHARYLRVVRGRELPQGSIGFFTAFDIACAELAAGRLGSDQVLKIGEAVLRSEKNSRLIPWFSLKPPDSFIPLFVNPDQSVLDLWKQIQKKILGIPKRKTKS